MNFILGLFVLLTLGIGLFLVFRKYFCASPYAILSNHTGKSCKIDLILADTPRKRNIGLMYQKQLPENSGMIFIFDKPVRTDFWMKNTLIPLDMIVISPDLKVVDIKMNLVPMSDDPIISDALSSYVIEVNAGFCERNGIAIGDTVSLHLNKLF